MDTDKKMLRRFTNTMNNVDTSRKPMEITIDELFGTLQHSVIATWRKHLRSAKYSKHMALDEFYKKMPELVDNLIEVWMGAKGHKVSGFENVVKSTNLNTIKYLQELRGVVKAGYSLMEGDKELEACLDDIMALIDSTLYKVKELSESETNDFKDLKEFLNESLLVEGKTDYAFVWDHFDPSILYCLNGATNKLQKDLKDYDYELQNVKISSNICYVMWNDEFLAVNDCDGNNLNAVKNNVLKTIEDQMTKDGNDETYRYFETAFGTNEWYDDGAESNKAKDYLNRFIGMIEDSKVDGDSGYGRAVIDVKNGETLLAGDVQVVFMTANEFLENVKAEEDAE